MQRQENNFEKTSSKTAKGASLGFAGRHLSDLSERNAGMGSAPFSPLVQGGPNNYRKPKIIMSKMPQNRTFTPRKGQQDLIKYLPQIKSKDVLSVQWPTGYGKSIGFALAWKHCFEAGIANRFLIVVANDTQRQQILNDFAGDCVLVGAPCNGGIWSFQRSAGDLREAKNGQVKIFVCTVQQLDASMRAGGVNTLKDLMLVAGTKWFVGFDEFHHYGEAMAWGNSAKLTMENASFCLAMSATPYRRGADTVFPQPELTISYQEAVGSKCVKPVVCHSYEYSVAVIEAGEEIANYTTTELHRISGGELDQWEERKNIRYSPQYLHPLIIYPLSRLRQMRGQTGKRLQMLVRAMSCRHAKMICEQIRQFADGLNVDWIGTGSAGRDDRENRNVLNKFCPPKNSNGERPEPLIDILVQVSMAGEGFDSINVSEIVDLFPVSAKAISGKATQDKQFFGRGARIINGAEDMFLSVNVPSDHPLHAWAGRSLERWMDASGSAEEVIPRESAQAPEFNLWDFPDLPKKREIMLLTVVTDQRAFNQFTEEVTSRARGRYNSNDPIDLEELRLLYLSAQNSVEEIASKQTRHFQVREYIDALVGRIASARQKQSKTISVSEIGMLKKEINGTIKRKFNRSRDEMTTDELEEVFYWLRSQLSELQRRVA